MPFHVYIIYSVSKDSYYVGYTGDILNERIRKHNANYEGFTGGYGDWKPVYKESFEHKTGARLRRSEIQS